MKAPTLQAFSAAKLPASLWKNGGGITREIVCQPRAEAFDWRVSIAHIAKDGPFSAFPGVDRVITLLEGGGVWLRSADGSVDHLLEMPLQPFGFPGEASVDGRLLLGACDDFNVMTRRAVCRCRAKNRCTRVAACGGRVRPPICGWKANPRMAFC
jgi:environmental stress-induced protein Ves